MSPRTADVLASRDARTALNPLVDFLGALGRLHALPKVYPGYIAMRVKNLLRGNGDPENIIANVGDVETIGDSRYQIEITDLEATKYLVTIEVARNV
jgi:hypothetical protein